MQPSDGSVSSVAHQVQPYKTEVPSIANQIMQPSDGSVSSVAHQVIQPFEAAVSSVSHQVSQPPTTTVSFVAHLVVQPCKPSSSFVAHQVMHLSETAVSSIANQVMQPSEAPVCSLACQAMQPPKAAVSSVTHKVKQSSEASVSLLSDQVQPSESGFSVEAHRVIQPNDAVSSVAHQVNQPSPSVAVSSLSHQVMNPSETAAVSSVGYKVMQTSEASISSVAHQVLQPSEAAVSSVAHQVMQVSETLGSSVAHQVVQPSQAAVSSVAHQVKQVSEDLSSSLAHYVMPVSENLVSTVAHNVMQPSEAAVSSVAHQVMPVSENLVLPVAHKVLQPSEASVSSVAHQVMPVSENLVSTVTHQVMQPSETAVSSVAHQPLQVVEVKNCNKSTASQKKSVVFKLEKEYAGLPLDDSSGSWMDDNIISMEDSDDEADRVAVKPVTNFGSGDQESANFEKNAATYIPESIVSLGKSDKDDNQNESVKCWSSVVASNVIKDHHEEYKFKTVVEVSKPVIVYEKEETERKPEKDNDGFQKVEKGRKAAVGLNKQLSSIEDQIYVDGKNDKAIYGGNNDRHELDKILEAQNSTVNANISQLKSTEISESNYQISENQNVELSADDSIDNEKSESKVEVIILNEDLGFEEKANNNCWSHVVTKNIESTVQEHNNDSSSSTTTMFSHAHINKPVIVYDSEKIFVDNEEVLGKDGFQVVKASRKAKRTSSFRMSFTGTDTTNVLESEKGENLEGEENKIDVLNYDIEPKCEKSTLASNLSKDSFWIEKPVFEKEEESHIEKKCESSKCGQVKKDEPLAEIFKQDVAIGEPSSTVTSQNVSWSSVVTKKEQSISDVTEVHSDPADEELKSIKSIVNKPLIIYEESALLSSNDQHKCIDDDGFQQAKVNKRSQSVYSQVLSKSTSEHDESIVKTGQPQLILDSDSKTEPGSQFSLSTLCLNISRDTFWLDKNIYEDAEAKYFRSKKLATVHNSSVKTKTDDDNDDSDKKGFKTQRVEIHSPKAAEQQSSQTVTQTKRRDVYSWSDESTYLSPSIPVLEPKGLKMEKPLELVEYGTVDSLQAQSFQVKFK